MPLLKRKATHATLQRVARRSGTLQSLAAGQLLLKVVAAVPAKNPMYAGGESKIINYYADGRFVLQEHVISMPDGSTPHRHLKMVVTRRARYTLSS